MLTKTTHDILVLQGFRCRGLEVWGSRGLVCTVKGLGCWVYISAAQPGVCRYFPGASFDTFISARLVVVALSRFSALQQCVRTKRAKNHQTSNYLPFNG